MSLIVLAAALSGPAIIESCEWSHPGAAPYTGTSKAAIMAMPMPLEVRQRLAARAPDSYDHFVIVDRDSIRTNGAEFSPNISYLNFSTGKKICAGVDRRAWKADHVETAIVYCDAQSGWCVGKFAVCGNWAIFFKLAARPPAIVPGVPVGEVVMPVPVIATVPAVLAPIPTTFEGYGPGFIGGGGFYGGGGSYGDGGGGYCITCSYICPPAAPVSPVPEPETWLIMALGLGFVIRRIS